MQMMVSAIPAAIEFSRYRKTVTHKRLSSHLAHKCQPCYVCARDLKQGNETDPIIVRVASLAAWEELKMETLDERRDSPS